MFSKGYFCSVHLGPDSCRDPLYLIAFIFLYILHSYVNAEMMLRSERNRKDRYGDEGDNQRKLEGRDVAMHGRGDGQEAPVGELWKVREGDLGVKSAWPSRRPTFAVG